MTIMEKPVSTPASGVVGSFVTEARLDALNAALAAHGVDASSHHLDLPAARSAGRQFNAAPLPGALPQAVTA